MFSDDYEQIKINDLSSVTAVVSSRSEGKYISGLELVDDIKNLGFINVKKGWMVNILQDKMRFLY